MNTRSYKTKICFIVVQIVLLNMINPGVIAQAKCEKNKIVIKEYLQAISGQAKDETMLKKYIDNSDSILIKHILSTESSFPKFELITEDIICEGDIVAIRGILKGKHLGPMGDIKPTGKDFNVSLFVFYRIKNDKIVEHWLVGDTYTMLKQLGVIE
jgi:predicted ester cyclase